MLLRAAAPSCFHLLFCEVLAMYLLHRESRGEGLDAYDVQIPVHIVQLRHVPQHVVDRYYRIR